MKDIRDYSGASIRVYLKHELESLLIKGHPAFTKEEIEFELNRRLEIKRNK